MESIFLGLQVAQWVSIGISVLIVILTAFLGRWILSFLLGKLVKRLVGNTRTMLDDAILDTIQKPFIWLMVVIALKIAVTRLDFLPENWAQPVDDVFFVLYFVIGTFFAWRFVSNLFTWYGEEMVEKTETELDEQLLPFFRRVALIILGVVLLIILFGHFGVDVSALVTTLGIGSLAIALAAQAALADTISGFVIMIDRPYRIGDRIEVADLDTWGDVVDIGLRSSRIRTRDNRMVIIPNSVIAKSLVVNHSYPDTQYRIQIHIGIGYESDIELARQVMVDAIKDVDGILKDKPIEALFLEFGDSALVFRVRWWIESYVDTRRMFDKVNTVLFKALNDANIEIPFPQRGIHHIFASDDIQQIAGGLRIDK